MYLGIATFIFIVLNIISIISFFNKKLISFMKDFYNWEYDKPLIYYLYKKLEKGIKPNEFSLFSFFIILGIIINAFMSALLSLIYPIFILMIIISLILKKQQKQK